MEIKENADTFLEIDALTHCTVILHEQTFSLTNFDQVSCASKFLYGTSVSHFN